MKGFILAGLFLASSLVTAAAESVASNKVQQGRYSTVHLLATARIAGNVAPDGMRFLFLVVRKSDVTGQFTLKETRDFQLGAASYQEKTQTELGQRFEPGTRIDNAESFFAKQPDLRGHAPENIEGAHILTLSIGGTKLPPGAPAEVTLHVGFDKQIEPFTFRTVVPPDRPPK